MRALGLGVGAALLTFGVGGCIVLGCIMDGSCFSAGERSAAWVRKEVRVGMGVPQLVHLAESAPSNQHWIVALEKCTAPTDTYYMHKNGNGYIGTTIVLASSGLYDRSQQEFAKREDMLAAVPYQLLCRSAEVSFPHWRVPMSLDTDSRVERVFDITYND